MLVAGELEPLAQAMRAELGLGEPFRDPGVGAFGLTNAVYALGDCFLEIVSPAREGTTAGRYLERHGGDGGYMLIFDLEDLEGARERAQRLGVRAVWQVDLPDISATHLHPADMRGAIVSLDRSNPYGSWRWGGPEWTGRIGTGAQGRLRGVGVAVIDPAGAAARWGKVLGIAPGEDRSLSLEDARVSFLPAVDERSEGLVEIELELPEEVRKGREAIQLGGVRVRTRAMPSSGERL